LQAVDSLSCGNPRCKKVHFLHHDYTKTVLEIGEKYNFTTTITGWHEKVSHYHKSSLIRIKILH